MDALLQGPGDTAGWTRNCRECALPASGGAALADVARRLWSVAVSSSVAEV
ncbi:MAG: hypothetical protein R3B13_00185 [Polyangiaceae bacterium]